MKVALPLQNSLYSFGFKPHRFAQPSVSFAGQKSSKKRFLGFYTGLLAMAIGAWNLLSFGKNLWHWNPHETMLTAPSKKVEPQVDQFLEKAHISYHQFSKEKAATHVTAAIGQGAIVHTGGLGSALTMGLQTNKALPYDDHFDSVKETPKLKAQARTVARAIVQALYHKHPKWLQYIQKNAHIKVFDTQHYWSWSHRRGGKVSALGHVQVMFDEKKHLTPDHIEFVVSSRDNPEVVRQTTVHELTHALDALKEDGTQDLLMDGILPFWNKQERAEFKRLRRLEISRMAQGRSALRGYALTNPQEFLAVSADTYLTRPHVMKIHSPELYDFMHRSFEKPSIWTPDMKNAMLALLMIIGGGTLLISSTSPSQLKQTLDPLQEQPPKQQP